MRGVDDEPRQRDFRDAQGRFQSGPGRTWDDRPGTARRLCRLRQHGAGLARHLGGGGNDLMHEPRTRPSHGVLRLRPHVWVLMAAFSWLRASCRHVAPGP